MTVFLYENIQVVPGQTAEYIRAFGDRWLPLSDQYDRDLYRISGFFTPDVLNTSHPAVTALWTIDSWETWDKRHSRGTPTERLIKTSEFYMPALTWRSGWTDKMLESLPFSPTPPSRPDSARPGAIVIVNRFIIEPKSCSAFVEAFERDVVAAASGVGLQLELFARRSDVRPSTSHSGPSPPATTTRRGATGGIQGSSTGSSRGFLNAGRCWSTRRSRR